MWRFRGSSAPREGRHHQKYADAEEFHVVASFHIKDPPVVVADSLQIFLLQSVCIFLEPLSTMEREIAKREVRVEAGR